MSTLTLTPEELSDLIGLVYDSAFEEQQWLSLLKRMTQLFPGIGGVAWGYEGDTMLPEYVSASPTMLFPRSFEFNMKSNFGETMSDAVKRVPNGYVARTWRLYPEQELLNSRCYQDYMKPQGYRNSLHLKVDHNGDRGALLGFPIPEDPQQEKAIHDPLFELLKFLAPHAVRASQLARALTLAKRATEVFGGFLDGIILPMVVTNASGRYLFANGAGRRVLDRGDLLRLGADGMLKLAHSHDTRELYHKLSQTNRDLVQGGMRIEKGDSPLMLAISPFRPSMRDASAFDKHLLDDERMFAVFVGQSEGEAVNTALLEDVFDLSVREAQVCKSLLMGQSATVIALNSHRSPKTVRNQIQMIYEKIGVSSNAELLDRLSVFRTVGTMFENTLGGRALTETL